MLDLVGNPEDRFSHNKAHFIFFLTLGDKVNQHHPQDKLPLTKDQMMVAINLFNSSIKEFISQFHGFHASAIEDNQVLGTMN